MSYIFTFGTDHKHPVDRSSLGKRYIELPGNYEETRALMLFLFGKNWAFQYRTKSDAGVTRFGLLRMQWPFSLEVIGADEAHCTNLRIQYVPDGEIRYLTVHSPTCHLNDEYDWNVETHS